MRYSFDQIEAFVLAAKHSSFSRAAKVLGKAQSTVSLAISNLEIDLGVQLFDRSSKYPKLTGEGRALLAEAESVLFHCRVFEERSLNLLKEVEASVCLAVDETLPPDLLSRALQAMTEEYPHIGVTALSPGAGGVAELIRDGEADLGLTLVNYRYPQDVGFYRLGQIHLVNVVHRDHPLASAKTIRFSHLNATRQIAYAPNHQKMPTNQHLDSSSVWTFTTYSQIIEMVMRGMGWAILPLHLAEPYLASGDFVKLRLEAYPTTPWRVNVDVIWSLRRKPGAVASWLKEYLGKKSTKIKTIT